MPPKKQFKDVTIRGGVNVATQSPTPKSTTKNDTAGPKEQKPAASEPPEKPTQ